MTRSKSKRVLASALTASLAVHAGLCVVAIRTAVGAETAASLRFDAGPPMQLAWADELPLPEPQPEPEPEKPKPEEAPVPLPPPEPEEINAFPLGIAKSDLDTKNWIGFSDPTPHEAPLAEVEQPALEPDAGQAGSQSQPTPPAAVVAAQPARPPGQPQPPLSAPNLAPTEQTSEPAATQPENTRPADQPSDRQPVDAGGAEASAPEPPPEEGTPQPEMEDPDRPLFIDGPGEVEQLAAELKDGFVGPPFEASDAENADEESALAEATPPAAPPAPPTAPPAEQPGESGEQSAAVIAAATTAPGGKPGEQSEREADATSLKDPISIRLGKPAAAEGLEIVTKRPDYSLVARVLSYPTKNPRLKVTFNREGRVRTAVFLDPTGLSDIDSPTLHAVYRWTARGEALNKLPKDDPEAGLSITVTILLR